MMNYLINMNRYLRITILLSCFFGSFVLFYYSENVIFILLSFIFLGILIASNVSVAKHTLQSMEQSLEITLTKNKFNADDSFLSDDFLTGLAINESSSKLVILNRDDTNENFRLSFIEFDDIIDCSIKEDGNTVTSSSKGSVIGGAIAGGIFAGGVGSVVGGLSANRTSNEKIVKSTLSIVVDDLRNPIYDIHFLNSKVYIDKNSDVYQNIYSNMNLWFKRLEVIIKRNQVNSKLM